MHLYQAVSLPVGKMIGKYQIRRKIAEGGMAEIYLCSFRGPEGFEKEVVIKRIRSFLARDPAFVRMFIAEARLASRLTHANLVQIFDFDKHGDSYYLAMEYVRGQSLWAARQRSKQRMLPFSPTLVAHIGLQVARGLHYAHTLTEKGQRVGLVHRDVSPHNVLLSYNGEVKLTDFGIAKVGNQFTAPGALKGKFAYMSPEQATGEDVDARSDIFGLGIVLWEMLTGARLFDGDGDVAVLRAVRESRIAPPARLNPDISPELDQAVMKALQRDPQRRYQTAGELERALGQYLINAAKSVEDTDVAQFLSSLFPRESSVSTESGASQSAPSEPSEVSLMPAVSEGTQPPHFSSGLWPAEASTEVEVEDAWESRTAGTTNENAGDTSSETPRLSGVELRARHNRKRRTLLGSLALLFIVPTIWITLRSRAGDAPSASSTANVDSPPLTSVSPATPSVVPFDAGFAVETAEARSAPNNALVGESAGSREEPSRTHSTPHPGPAMGTLIVRVTPWATLSIDGRSRGEVIGVRRYRLKAGSHRLRFEHPKRNEERVVHLAKNQELMQEYHAL